MATRVQVDSLFLMSHTMVTINCTVCNSFTHAVMHSHTQLFILTHSSLQWYINWVTSLDASSATILHLILSCEEDLLCVSSLLFPTVLMSQWVTNVFPGCYQLMGGNFISCALACLHIFFMFLHTRNITLDLTRTFR